MADNVSKRNESARQHGSLFKSLIELTYAKTIVEIGVMYGSTTKWLCNGARTVGGHVYGFDTWKSTSVDISKEYNNDYPDKLIVPNFNSTKSAVENQLIEYNNYYTLFQIDTQTTEFHDTLNANCPIIDFAFIDAQHTYNSVKNDFFNVYPLLSETGIIALHDTFFIDGCREFVLDLRTKYNDGTFDIIDFPFGHDDQRVGVSILVKRSYPVIKDNSIRIVQGSPSLSGEIIRREKEWYEGEIK